MAKQKFVTSVINHNIRVALGLTCDEYVVMDLLMTNYCNQPYNYYGRFLWLLGDQPWIAQATDDLCDKKMIFISYTPIGSVYIISEKWLAYFNINADFAEFWHIFREHGNKASAETNYNIVRKSVDKETLHGAAKSYLQYCDETYSDTKFVNQAQVWLDPKKQRWTDKLKMVKPVAENVPNKKFDFL